MHDMGIYFDLTPTFYSGGYLKIAEPVIVLSPEVRAERLSSAARGKQRYDQLVQRVLKSGVKFAAGSDMCWFYPGKTRGEASIAALINLRTAGMSSLETIRAITSSAAEMLGWQDRIGAIVPLKATYFAAARPGPGVLLLHQINRDRKSWDAVAAQLAAAGMNALTLDLRGFGESGTPLNKLTDAERSKYQHAWPDDVDAAFGYLSSQPGVVHTLIGVGGAGWLGVLYSVDAARRHPEQIRSLVLISGETLRDGLQFLHQASRLPELFVFSDDDEYPPTQDAMKLLYATASSPSKKLVHYAEAEDAPWLWYEDSSGKVPAHGGHGTDMFQIHLELTNIIVHWFVTTLVKTPGHATIIGRPPQRSSSPVVARGRR
jgi:dienelactone hydrolase